MTAETLRRAAALMRERADAAEQGLWSVMAQQVVAANAPHVASWHPLVALAVADWLDAVADKHAEAVRMGLGALASGIHYHREATAVARAYLGDQS